MTRFRVRFLPAFFTVLAIAFAIAVFFRIRAHSLTDEPPLAAGLEPDAPLTATQTTASLDASEPPPIVEAPTGTDTATTRAAAAREQRYKELLNAAPPPGAPVQPPPKQSTIAKILAPIASVFTGNTPKPQPPPQAQREVRSVARDSVQLAPGQQEAQLAQTNEPGRAIGDGKEPRKPNDPSSDTTPPQLMSVEFIPSVVRDGEEIVLIIGATDQLSGIRSISGNVASPAGALQGFALQREGENRFVTKITIPKDAAEGTWRINYLSLSDNAGNMVTLNQATGLPGSATFRVASSRPDSAPPTLKALWIDKPSMRGGERNQIFIQAEDDKSGVSLVAGVFLSPSKNARLGFGCRGGAPEGTWTCDFNPPSNSDCGDWSLEQVQLQDRANNMTAVRSDNSLIAAARINISSDQCDSEPPVLQQVILEPREVSNVEASQVRITVTAADDRSGVANVSGHVAGPITEGAQPPRVYFSLSAAANDPRTWTGTATIPKLAAKGTWVIGAIQILDKANNLKIIGQNDPLLQGNTFTVH